MSKDDLLERWLAGSLSDAELKKFEQSEEFGLHNDILEGAKAFKASNFSELRSYNAIKAKLQPQKPKVIAMQSYKTFMRIAAVFVVGFSLYFAFFFNNLTTIQSLASEQSNFELPDDSHVVLNADSKVVFNKNKWSEKRELQLDGEAYFKVAKGSKFDVKTSGGLVSVLGTQFTVKQRDSYFEVKCFEGVVSVQDDTQTYKLTRGHSYRFLSGEVKLDTVTKSDPEWLHNITNFNSVPLSQVFKELERQYDIDIKVENVDTKRIFTGGFVHDSLQQAITSIISPLNLVYKKENSKKIIIYKDEQQQ